MFLIDLPVFQSYRGTSTISHLPGYINYFTVTGVHQLFHSYRGTSTISLHQRQGQTGGEEITKERL